MAQTAQTSVTVYNFNLFSQNDIPEYWEKRKNCGKCGFTINDEERYMVDFEAIGKIPDTGPSFVGMGDDDDFVTAVDEFA